MGRPRRTCRDRSLAERQRRSEFRRTFGSTRCSRSSTTAPSAPGEESWPGCRPRVAPTPTAQRTTSLSRTAAAGRGVADPDHRPRLALLDRDRHRDRCRPSTAAAADRMRVINLRERSSSLARGGVPRGSPGHRPAGRTPLPSAARSGCATAPACRFPDPAGQPIQSGRDQGDDPQHISERPVVAEDRAVPSLGRGPHHRQGRSQSDRDFSRAEHPVRDAGPCALRPDGGTGRAVVCREDRDPARVSPEQPHLDKERN